MLGERDEQPARSLRSRDDVFEVLGFHLEQESARIAVAGFSVSFPLVAGHGRCGHICAILAGALKATLARSLMVAFFLTMCSA